MRNWIQLMIRCRKLVVFMTGLLTVLLLIQLKDLQIIIDPDNILPRDHHFVKTNDLIEETFGNKFTVVVAMTPKTGDIYQTQFLEKVKEITSKIENAPGAIKSHIIATAKAKQIMLTPSGPIPVPILEKIPKTEQEMLSFKAALHSDPIFNRLLYSDDEKTTQVIAEFSKIEGGFKAIEKNVRDAIAPSLDGTVEIEVGGLPIFLSALESFSERMGFLFPLALILIGLIHYEAFRTKQALILPLVTALLAVVWAVGGLGLMRQSFDVFNASTPILILAIAAGHAVQILKRYYEEFNIIKKAHSTLSAKEVNFMAVEETLTKVGPVMVVACTVAALGFFSLVIFEIKTIRTFGLFTGFGVLSALIIELTFIPALRAMLPPPGEAETNREHQISFWDKIVSFLYDLASHKRNRIYSASFVLLILFSLGAYWVKVDNSQKEYFLNSLQVKKDDFAINKKMAGTNVIYVLIDGKNPNSISDLATIQGIEKTQEFLNNQPQVGKTISINNFIKRMNQALNMENKDFYRIPEDPRSLGMLLQFFSEHGAPGEFDSWIDRDHKKAVIAAFIKTDSSAYIEDLTKKINSFAVNNFPSTVSVDIGGGAVNGVALNEVMIREKILNIVQILLAVFLVSSLVFRSFMAGLLILVPLIAAVVVNFGVMGLFSIPLQIATALVSAMAVGIGADYGIYMSYRMREELRKDQSEDVALNKAYLSAGKATLFVSSAVAGGFGILMISWGFLIHIWMGFLIATAMLTSSIAALTLFPALVMTLRPKFIFENRK
jgi:predicted RND superfamily exporter protein